MIDNFKARPAKPLEQGKNKKTFMDTKKTRFALMMYVLGQILEFGGTPLISWYNRLKERSKSDFDKAYDEANEFISDNQDIILLLLTSLNQCRGISPKTEEAIQNFKCRY